jgi:tetratricopeptide (TPR) repeat protein
LRRNPSPALRYFGLRAFRFQTYFSLIYYPVFTLFLSVGDWRTIYDFRSTPLLSGITAVLHAGALLGFWLLERQGWFEAPGVTSLAEEQELETLRTEITHNPGDTQRAFRYIDKLLHSGAPRQARARLRRVAQDYPDLAVGHLLMALAEVEGKAQVSSHAAREAQQALQLGLENEEQVALAHHLLGRHQLERGDGQAAVTHLTQAIASTSKNGHSVNLAQLHHQRSLAYRRLRQYGVAYEDIQQAITHAQTAGNAAAEKRYREELEVLEKHAGRRLAPPN